MPQEFSVGVVIYNNGEFLLLRRFPGHWSFLKDKITETDDKEITARNLCQNEIGIKTLIFVKGFQETEAYFFKKQGQTIHKEVVFLLVETNEKDVTLSGKHLGHAWLDFERAMTRITFKPEKELLKKAYEHLKYNK